MAKTISTTIIMIIVIFLYGCKFGEKEIIVVPHNYTGYAIIIYNQKGGSKERYLGGKRVYEIPANGILKTQFSGNYGDIGIPEFYYEKILSTNRIPYVVLPKNLLPEAIVASGGSTGIAHKSSDDQSPVEFQVFYIGTEKQMDKAYKDADKLNIAKLSD